MNNRSRDEILAKMLDALSHGEVSSTRILYHAMLSNDQCKGYMTFLYEKGLMIKTFDDNKSRHRLYNITEKGRELLRIIKEMTDMVSIPVEEQSEPEIGPEPEPEPEPEIVAPIPKAMIQAMQMTRKIAENDKTKNPVDKVRERRDVQNLWNNGIRNTWMIAKMMGTTRGVVYNHLRRLGLKPRTITKG